MVSARGALNTHTLTHTDTHKHTQTHTHTRSYAHTHTHKHTHTHTQVGQKVNRVTTKRESLTSHGSIKKVGNNMLVVPGMHLLQPSETCSTVYPIGFLPEMLLTTHFPLPSFYIMKYEVYE